MAWEFEGKTINSLSQIPKQYKDSFGFIYCIVFHNSAEEYYGRKNLFTTRSKVASSKQVAAKGKSAFRRKKVKKGKKAGEWQYYEIDRKESNWNEYTSSSKLVNEKIKNGHDFTKYIIEFVKEESMMTYREAKVQMCSGVLEEERFLNDNVLGRFYKKNIIGK